LSVIPQIITGDGSDYTFTFNLTVGCGASTIPFPQKFPLVHPGFPPITQLITIPASNIMINCTMAAAIGSPAGTSFQVAAMAAPITDPSYFAELVAHMRGEEGNARQPGDDMHGRPFVEEGLAWHHNR
jgi:hypothetical protein